MEKQVFEQTACMPLSQGPDAPRHLHRLEAASEQPHFDRSYLCRLREGDWQTQRHFAQHFGRLLNIKLVRRLRSPELREEVRQETLLRTLTIVYRGGVRNPEALGSLVNSICNHVLYEFFRAEGREFAGTEIAAECSGTEAGPELAVLCRERASHVRQILHRLPSKDRSLLQQVLLEERDKDEVCRTFRVSRDYLRVMLHRAKKRFRAYFSENATHAPMLEMVPFE